MIERRAGPARRRMARIAGGWEPGRNMVWAVSAVVVRLVATVTGRRGEIVISSHVTRRTSSRRVHTGQRPAGLAVIEGCARPVGGRVASVAGGREPGRCVGRVIGAVVVVLVAIDASRTVQAVVVIDVALRALHGGVEAGEREPRRVAGAVEVLQMATGAIGGHGRKLSAGMTQSAGNRGVRSGQWELCEVVIELRPLPSCRCVARITLC